MSGRMLISNSYQLGGNNTAVFSTQGRLQNTDGHNFSRKFPRAIQIAVTKRADEAGYNRAKAHWARLAVPNFDVESKRIKLRFESNPL